MSPTQTLLQHHLYEIRKGVRQLVLLTLPSEEVPAVLARLELDSVTHFLQPVGPAKANLFFGRGLWVETARRIVSRPLAQLSPEEDFILGTLLGYDREQQCQRFLIQSSRAAAAFAIAAE
ncbi:DUF2023 family protein [Phaeospirillum tilakii]|uniref:DUF2023 family protein n=1 Tax=Phaeospirillum tilakii TaxID=741673 RepID=A0ABW5CFB4_9PROT